MIDVEKLTVAIMGSDLVRLYGISSVDAARYHATRIAKVYDELEKGPLPPDVVAAARLSPSLPRSEMCPTCASPDRGHKFPVYPGRRDAYLRRCDDPWHSAGAVEVAPVPP